MPKEYRVGEGESKSATDKALTESEATLIEERRRYDRCVQQFFEQRNFPAMVATRLHEWRNHDDRFLRFLMLLADHPDFPSLKDGRRPRAMKWKKRRAGLLYAITGLQEHVQGLDLYIKALSPQTEEDHEVTTH